LSLQTVLSFDLSSWKDLVNRKPDPTSRQRVGPDLDALMQAGFTESVVFEGEEAANEVDAKGENANPIEKVRRRLATT
jgi:hypothetical protein